MNAEKIPKSERWKVVDCTGGSHLHWRESSRGIRWKAGWWPQTVEIKETEKDKSVFTMWKDHALEEHIAS